MREYEVVMVLRPDMDEAGISQLMEGIEGLVTEKGGVLLKEERWGKRRLAHPIDRLSEGHYVVAHVQGGPDVTQQLDSTLRASEPVLRHLLLKKEA